MGFVKTSRPPFSTSVVVATPWRDGAEVFVPLSFNAGAHYQVYKENPLPCGGQAPVIIWP